AEIAENEGITRQGVRDSLKRAEGLLLEMEQKLGLAARFRRMEAGINEIRECIRVIADINERHSYSREIFNRAGRILAALEQLAEI
ncbi:MAG: DNA-binding protein, partial [Oscillospiraceae bacterium]|nr:DNA-binding protein [Oscillospiraceae bacterium]